MGDLENQLKKFNTLKNQFNEVMPDLRDIGDYILPRRAVFSSDGKPDQKKNRYSKRVNDAATRANRTAGAGLQGGLSSAARPWFRISLADKDLAKFSTVKTYLSAVEDAYYSVFAGSNFYGQIHKCYEDEAGFGTCPMLTVPDFKRVVNFRVVPCGQYYIANGPYGMVDILYRTKWMQAGEIVRDFGNNTTHRIKRMAEKDPFYYFEIIHMIEPRLERDRNLIDAANMAYRSLWLDPADITKPLRDSGFEYFPAIVPRWDVVGDSAYGNGPGHDAMGMIKSLQEYEKTIIMSIHKGVNPPTAAPATYKGVVDLRPGKVNYGVDSSQIASLYDHKISIADLDAKIAKTEYNIERTYYNDLFLMISSTGKQQTAYEVAEKHEEKIQLLGPTIERQIAEGLNPLMDIVYKIMAERPGFLPPPPQEMIGVDFKIEYISLLAQAQKLVDANAVNDHLTLIERVNSLGPEGQKAVVVTTNFEELLRTHSQAVGVPDKVVYAEEESAEIKEDIAAQEAEIAQQQQAMAAADAASKLGSASTESGTALGDLVENAEQ